MLLNVKNCFNITNNRSAMLKFKCLKALLSVVISVTVIVIQHTLSSVVLFINIKVIENLFLIVIINLFKLLSKLHITFSITVKSQFHSVLPKVNIFTKMIIKIISSAKIKLLTVI